MSIASELELEYENESEFELTNELEYELGLANALVNEYELEHELQGEHEAFFNHLAAMADRAGRSQALRRIARVAARAALQGKIKPWPVVEGETELGEFEFVSELGELESEFELEFEYTPAQLARFAAMMEHSGHAAAEAANEQEAAEHFLPLIGLAAKFVLPKLAGLAAKKLGGLAAKKVGGQLIRKIAPRLIRRFTPQLTRGLANVTRTLFRNRTTRPLVHAVPRIARGTVYRLGRQIAAGKRITPQQAVQTLAQQTARTLSNPKTLAQTYRRSKALDHRYHQRTRKILGVPAGAPVRAAGLPRTTSAGYSPGYVGAGAPTNGCRCVCQPVSDVAPPHFAASMAVPSGMSQAVASCPTCGR